MNFLADIRKLGGYPEPQLAEISDDVPTFVHRGADAADTAKENARIQNIMNNRRELMKRQIEASAIQNELCDFIRLKYKTPELEKQIAGLGEFAPELYEYIRKLERINNGLWCNKCEDIIETQTRTSISDLLA